MPQGDSKRGADVHSQAKPNSAKSKRLASAADKHSKRAPAPKHLDLVDLADRKVSAAIKRSIENLMAARCIHDGGELRIVKGPAAKDVETFVKGGMKVSAKSHSDLVKDAANRVKRKNRKMRALGSSSSNDSIVDKKKENAKKKKRRLNGPDPNEIQPRSDIPLIDYDGNEHGTSETKMEKETIHEEDEDDDENDEEGEAEDEEKDSEGEDDAEDDDADNNAESQQKTSSTPTNSSRATRASSSSNSSSATSSSASSSTMSLWRGRRRPVG